MKYEIRARTSVTVFIIRKYHRVQIIFHPRKRPLFLPCFLDATDDELSVVERDIHQAVFERAMSEELLGERSWNFTLRFPIAFLRKFIVRTWVRVHVKMEDFFSPKSRGTNHQVATLQKCSICSKFPFLHSTRFLLFVSISISFFFQLNENKRCKTEKKRCFNMSLDLKMPSFADFFSNHTIPKTRITKKQVGNLHGSWHTIDDWETRLKNCVMTQDWLK